MSVAAIRAMPTTSITKQDYVMLSPDGFVLVVPKQIFDALAMFMGTNRKHEAGLVEMQFRNGGVAGVEAKVRLK